MACYTPTNSSAYSQAFQTLLNSAATYSDYLKTQEPLFTQLQKNRDHANEATNKLYMDLTKIQTSITQCANILLFPMQIEDSIRTSLLSALLQMQDHEQYMRAAYLQSRTDLFIGSKVIDFEAKLESFMNDFNACERGELSATWAARSIYKISNPLADIDNALLASDLAPSPEILDRIQQHKETYQNLLDRLEAIIERRFSN